LEHGAALAPKRTCDIHVTPQDWERLKQVFGQALSLPPEERAAFADRVRLEDEKLGQDLADLIVGQEETEPLDSPLIDLHEFFPADPNADSQSSGDESLAMCGVRIPKVIAGRFRVLRHLGHGGMGEVFEVEDLQLKDRVALKTIRPEIALNPQVTARFKREILLGKRVAHPNVCRIHDLGSTTLDDGVEMLFLTMELLNGETLESRIKRGPMSTAEALPLIENMADGLAAAHHAGVIHRDFKSGNVMLVDSADGRRAVITDFGLARPSHETEDPVAITKSGAVAGTVAYMAPEQFKGEEATPAADIYALGIVMYEMLTGRRPFTGGSEVNVALKHIHEKPQPPSEISTQLDSRWDRVILGCLSKSPKDRFSSASAVKSALPGKTDSNAKTLGHRRNARVLLPAGIAVAGIVLVLSLAFSHAASNVGQHLYALIGGEYQGTVRRVLVGDIENHTGEAVLDHTVRELLASTLEQSSILKILSDSELADALRRMGRPRSAEIEAQLAVDLCQREDLHAAILGSVARLGGEYVIILKALDRRGEVVASVRASAHSQEQVIQSVEVASKALRKSLGESVQSITTTAPLERVTSPSLQAVQYYTLGKRELYDGKPEDASNFFQRAIESDPNFAMAHGYAGIAYQFLGDIVSSRKELSTAVGLSDRVAEPERLKILGDYSLAIQDFSQAVKYYQSLSQVRPDMAAAHFNMGQAYLGELNYERALAETDAGIRLQHGVGPEDNAIEILFLAGRTQEAVDRAARILRSHPQDTRALYLKARCLLALGEMRAAREILERLAASDSEGQSVGLAALADIASNRGQIDEARDELQRAVVADEKAHNPYGIALRTLELATLDREPSRDQAAGRADLNEIQDDDRLLILAAGLCRDEKSSARLQSIIAILEQHRASHETATVQSFLALAKGALARMEHRREDEIAFAQSAVRFENSTFAVDYLAGAFAASGMPREAISEFEKVLARSNERMETYDGPAFHRLREIHQELSGLYRKTGDLKRAEMHHILAVK
jgi:eukaryotic-like serine/threonine-protein kinase